ncbi:hypothetical protein DPMN_162995 [Dreissena polymorpha]|uniref:Uncharacterized protein n=1 Tax=Dreissena polymorpha TaxID=45954 RepID=A0A9D4IUT6_DREPO|nr:hypothetical protein DPMN_162995 [Dreissena polymorpha]
MNNITAPDDESVASTSKRQDALHQSYFIKCLNNYFKTRINEISKDKKVRSDGGVPVERATTEAACPVPGGRQARRHRGFVQIRRGNPQSE